VVLDAGAGGSSWAVWDACTEGDCAGHNKYQPSNGHDFYNFSILDAPSFGAGTSHFESWRVNDTFQFGDTAGNPVTPVTFDAAYSLDGPEDVDGNFGSMLFADLFYIYLYESFRTRYRKKFLHLRGMCNIHEFCGRRVFERSYIKPSVIILSGMRRVMVLSTSAENCISSKLNDFDNIAPGLTSVAQLGGVDKNKYTGEIDWIPMTQDSWWIAYDVTRTISTSSGSAPVTVDFNERRVIFDTGDGGLAGIPTDDWNFLINAAGATYDDDGNWWFPCDSTMSMALNGSQGVIYTVPLGDINNVAEYDSSMCAATMNSMGQGPNWCAFLRFIRSEMIVLLALVRRIMGLPFFSNYYMIFHYEANMMGLAAKNLGASALTTSVLIGPS
jgi:hypothetical protein